MCLFFMSFHRGSFRTGSTGSWEPVNFEESYTEVKIFGKNITEYLIILWMQNLGTRQLNFLTEPLLDQCFFDTWSFLANTRLMLCQHLSNASPMLG